MAPYKNSRPDLRGIEKEVTAPGGTWRITPSFVQLVISKPTTDRSGESRCETSGQFRLLARSLEIPYHAGSMVKYSCYFINAANHFESVEPLDAVSDRDALILAEELLHGARNTKAVEVWSQGELIGRVDRERA